VAHFARLENNIVVQIVVINNNDMMEDGIEIEQKGINFCKNLVGQDTEWIQTSYNSTFRKRYAGVGDTYDSNNDVFIRPQPFASWLLDDNFDWKAPIEMPVDGLTYTWDEETLSWKEIDGKDLI
jgi:hypothetical protein